LDHLFETSKVFSQAIHPVQVPDVKQAMKYCMGFGWSPMAHRLHPA
jgi:hypothetical protein